MKKILKNSARTIKYLNALPKIYLLGYWARYGVMEHYFTGKYNKNGVPLVYYYNDFNGTSDNFYLMPITKTTTGFILSWGLSKDRLQYAAELLNNSKALISGSARSISKQEKECN